MYQPKFRFSISAAKITWKLLYGRRETGRRNSWCNFTARRTFSGSTIGSQSSLTQSPREFSINMDIGKSDTTTVSIPSHPATLNMCPNKNETFNRHQLDDDFGFLFDVAALLFPYFPIRFAYLFNCMHCLELTVSSAMVVYQVQNGRPKQKNRMEMVTGNGTK